MVLQRETCFVGWFQARLLPRVTRPYQFALRTRAGVDALTARLRATLENDARATVVSLGRSAYDCISRAAFLSKLREVAPALVPFARLFHGRTSEYQWWDDDGDDDGVRHGIRQAEGCEQGDLLGPSPVCPGPARGVMPGRLAAAAG